MRLKPHFTTFLLTPFIFITLFYCEKHTETSNIMDHAEMIMETHPDSALIILDGLNKDNIDSGHESARFALLKSIALDKNYIDTTNFKVLQPAIDYYLKKGNANEKLRTYYYQGRIYQNRGESDSAMRSFIKGKDLISEASDSLTIGRLLTAQGTLLYTQYKYKEFVDNSLQCANLYKEMNMPFDVSIDYAKALNGSILMKNRSLSDSIYSLTTAIIDSFPDYKYILLPQIFIYKIAYGDDQEIRQYIDEVINSQVESQSYLDLAHAYSKLGDGEKAMFYLNKVDTTDMSLSLLKYYSIKSLVYSTNNQFKEALLAKSIYSNKLEKFHRALFSQDLLFAEKKHELELQNLAEIRQKDRIINYCIGGLLILIAIILILYYRHRLVKIRRELSEERVLKLEAEQESAKIEKEALELKNRNAKLIISSQKLESENLKLTISQLEEQRDNLIETLDKERMTEAVQLTIRERLDMLNKIIVGYITKSNTPDRPFEEWKKSMISDSKKLMYSTQMALRASYPSMFKVLESKNLSNEEIDYVCLYAIGLRGKEIGDYTHDKSHYHLSSRIRKKLGLTDSDTNIGIYIRSLMK